MALKLKQMKQSMKVNCPSDESIQKLYNSTNPDDYRLAVIYTLEKYKWSEHIVDFFKEINKKYNKKWGHPPSYVYCSKEHFVQIIVGNYGVYCKSLLGPVEIKYNNIIEWI